MIKVLQLTSDQSDELRIVYFTVSVPVSDLYHVRDLVVSDLQSQLDHHVS